MRVCLSLFLGGLIVSAPLFAAPGKHEVQVTKTKVQVKPASKENPSKTKQIKAAPGDAKHKVEETKKVETKTEEPQPKIEQPVISNRASQTNLPIPRFVCIKAGEANMHVGPGNTYPIEWKYVRKFLPVEIIAEFEHWRQVRDAQGTVGWLHKSLLSSKRFAMVQNKVVNLYTGPDMDSPVIATVEPGVVGKVQECFQSLCKIDIQGIKGWVKRDFLWGVYPDETKF